MNDEDTTIFLYRNWVSRKMIRMNNEQLKIKINPSFDDGIRSVLRGGRGGLWELYIKYQVEGAGVKSAKLPGAINLIFTFYYNNEIEITDLEEFDPLLGMEGFSAYYYLLKKKTK